MFDGGGKSESFSAGAIGHFGQCVETRGLLSAGLWEKSECFVCVTVFNSGKLRVKYKIFNLAHNTYASTFGLICCLRI